MSERRFRVHKEAPCFRPAPQLNKRDFEIWGMTGRAISEGPNQRLHGVGLEDLETAQTQGLTLVHFSAQLERIAWDRGCA